MRYYYVIEVYTVT